MEKSNITLKPWGFYVDLLRQGDVVLKKILVCPKEQLSYQYHRNRKEFWFISSGEGIFTLNGTSKRVHAGESLIISQHDKHMVENDGDEDLIFFEMQCGKCEEDDIVRITDKYNR
tara:strand:+ start:475 stop:819 length:345 start_codon:yes stop_codon:yes gene_type:complete